MITSNEPGFYIDGQYGMRIENLILCIDAPFDGYLAFETLTHYPLELALIEKSILTADEIAWINDYQRKSYEQISPLLSDEIRSWFNTKCATL
jgi:Xaa-Pro aminopeptidase